MFVSDQDQCMRPPVILPSLFFASSIFFCVLAVTERVEGSSTSIDPLDHVDTGLILFSLAAAAAVV